MDRFNFNKFNRLFDDFFSRNESFNFDQFLTGDNNLEKRVYTNEDGSVNVVYIKNGKNRNEIDGLKQKLDMAIENQEFELAVELRDRIKNLEQNQEEIKKLNDELKNHIQNQDFEKCIEVRDKINTLK
jgi:protein-arginine kinase activator protein McsA